MVFCHTLADGKANTCTSKLISAVQSLKYLKNSIKILYIKSNAFITYTDLVEQRRIAGWPYTCGQFTSSSKLIRY